MTARQIFESYTTFYVLLVLGITLSYQHQTEFLT